MDEGEQIMANELYNSLPGPDAAFEKIDPDKLDDVFAESFLIAKQFGLSGRLGLYLLHRHQHLKDDEVIVESEYENAAGRKGFMSRPLHAPKGAQPASWMMRDGAVVPFEYVDTSLSTHVQPFSEQTAVRHILELIASRGMGEVLGVGVSSRPDLTAPDAGSILVERDGPEARSQVVQYESNPKGKDVAIPTRWILDAWNRREATERHCIPLIICMRYSPGHAEENQGHDTGE